LGYEHYLKDVRAQIDSKKDDIFEKHRYELPIKTKPEFMTDEFSPCDDFFSNKPPAIRLTIQNLSKYVIIPQYFNKLFNLFKKYEHCPSKYDREFVREHSLIINFPLGYKSYSFEDMFRSWPSLIMNSVSRYQIPYESIVDPESFNFQMHKAGPLLARKMLKYNFKNMKYIGQNFISHDDEDDESDKFLRSHKSTKFYEDDVDDYDPSDMDIEVLSFHHCKMCKDLTSRHRRSMCAFVRYQHDYEILIHCFILF